MINYDGKKVICKKNGTEQLQNSLELKKGTRVECYGCEKQCMFWLDSEGYITHRFKNTCKDASAI